MQSKKIGKEIDLEAVKLILGACVTLMEERNLKYGDSWRVLTIPSVANLIEMKMHRIANLPAGAPKTRDEFMDTINYACMGLLKLTESARK